MLPKHPEKEDSSNFVDKKSKQSQAEAQIIGFLYFICEIFVIFIWFFLKIENIPSQQKLLAWCSYKNNKISIVELETKQEFTNFDGAKLNKTNGILQPFISDSNSLTIH